MVDFRMLETKKKLCEIQGVSAQFSVEMRQSCTV